MKRILKALKRSIPSDALSLKRIQSRPNILRRIF
jgi:hypothetical protein